MSDQGWITQDVTGFKELEAAFKRLPVEVARKELRASVLAGANVIKKAARENIPLGKGDQWFQWGKRWLWAKSRPSMFARSETRKRIHLRDVVAVKLKKSADGSKVSYFVGIVNRAKRGFYGLFLEFGTRPHTIRPKRAKALGVDGRFGKLVKHPGAKKSPWLRPAFDENIDASIEAMRKRLKKGIERQGERLARKG